MDDIRSKVPNQIRDMLLSDERVYFYGLVKVASVAPSRS